MSSCESINDDKILNWQGDKILVVRIGDKNDDVSEVELIKNALEKGGQLTLNVEVLKQLDNPKFSSKYTASGSDGRYFTRPAILNFVGGQGWRLLQIVVDSYETEYFFVKSRVASEVSMNGKRNIQKQR